MSAPPEGLPADALLARLQELPRPSTVVDFPRKDETGQPLGQVRLWVLRQGEMIVAQTSAEKKVQGLLKDKVTREQAAKGYEDAYMNALASEMLALACRRTDNPLVPFFPEGAAMVNRLLTSDEMSVLWEAYASWQAESGPIVGQLTGDEMEAWITRLQEGGRSIQLSFLSREALTSLLMFLVSRLPTSPTATSSSGSPPDANT